MGRVDLEFWATIGVTLHTDTNLTNDQADIIQLYESRDEDWDENRDDDRDDGIYHLDYKTLSETSRNSICEYLTEKLKEIREDSRYESGERQYMLNSDATFDSNTGKVRFKTSFETLMNEEGIRKGLNVEFTDGYFSGCYDSLDIAEVRGRLEIGIYLDDIQFQLIR